MQNDHHLFSLVRHCENHKTLLKIFHVASIDIHRAHWLRLDNCFRKSTSHALVLFYDSEISWILKFREIWSTKTMRDETTAKIKNIDDLDVDNDCNACQFSTRSICFIFHIQDNSLLNIPLLCKVFHHFLFLLLWIWLLDVLQSTKWIQKTMLFHQVLKAWLNLEQKNSRQFYVAIMTKY